MKLYRKLGVSPTEKSYSFRSYVRASEAVCARETMLLPRLGCKSSKVLLRRVRGRALPHAGAKQLQCLAFAC